MATVSVGLTEQPSALPLNAGQEYLIQNVSTRFEILVAQAASATRDSPAYRVAPLQYLGVRKDDGEDIYAWTDSGVAAAKITIAESI